MARSPSTADAAEREAIAEALAAGRYSPGERQPDQVSEFVFSELRFSPLASALSGRPAVTMGGTIGRSRCRPERAMAPCSWPRNARPRRAPLALAP
jgi:hypothetical protein